MESNDDMSKLTFEQLFEAGEEKYNQMDYDEAEYFYSLAYKKKPHEDMIVLCYSNILKHNNKCEEAKKLLLKSLKDNPNGTYKRFFQLAEIQIGQKSIKVFEEGIAAAKKCLNNPFLSTAPQAQVKRDIAQAYASIAEVCMTDLTNVPFEQVQPKCAEVLEKGKSMDPTCMDIYLQIANCCIEKNQNDLARNSLLIIKQAVLEQKQQYEDQLATQCAKLFMEIADYQSSIDVLEKINENQNNDPETVYLMAYCAFQMGKYAECKQYIEDYPSTGEMIDEQVDQAMKQLKVELNKKIKKGGEETEEGNEGIDDQQWVDMDQDVQ